MALKYSLLKKIYNALFYSVLEYINQLSMLSHVKYRNSNFTRIEKIKILSRHPNVKSKISLNIICHKKYTMPEDSRWRCENNLGLELFSLNPQTVSQSSIFRLIFVAHRTGQLPSIEKTRDARQ